MLGLRHEYLLMLLFFWEIKVVVINVAV